MAISEQQSSRGGGARSGISLIYHCWPHADGEAAHAEVLAAAPATYRSLVMSPLDSTVTPIVPGCWKVTIPYKALESQEPAETNDNVYSFEIGEGTETVTQSLETIARYAREGETAPDFKQAIGVTKDSVEGADVIVPTFHWTETVYQPWDVVTSAYQHAVYGLVGRTNAAAFRDFAIGEVQFRGASGTRRQNEVDWEIAYRFAASPNVTGLTIGEIEGVAKKGWEYLWVRFDDEEDETANTLVKVPTSVHIERLFDPGDFTLLLI